MRCDVIKNIGSRSTLLTPSTEKYWNKIHIITHLRIMLPACWKIKYC